MSCVIRQRFSFTFLVSVGLLVTLVGCSGGSLPTGKVAGKVTHNGQPVTSGSLTFAPAAGTTGKPATGAVNPDGSYTLTTNTPGDGAAIGRNKVIYAPGAGSSGPQQGSLEPGKHDEAKPGAVPFSGLVPKEAEVEVKAGSNEINIELVADPGAPAAPVAPAAPAEPAAPKE